MRIAVFGAGGVGGYFGGRLAQASEDVIFIARGAHLQAIRANGLRVDSLKGDFRVSPAHATDDPGQLGEVDAVLVAVKAWQVPEAAQAIRPMIGPQTCAVPLGNGVDAPGQLAAVLGREHVLGGLCQISTFIAGPGWIRHVGLEPKIVFGELDGGLSPRVERLRQAFTQAGVLVDVPADIHAAMWGKFLFITAVSGVGAVSRAPIGVTRSLPGTRQLLEQAMQEVLAVAISRQVRLEEDIVARTLASIDAMQPGVIPSMQRDITEGRPSELEAQTGAVVRLAQEVGIPAPLSTWIYHSLLPQEQRARGKLSF